MRRLSGRVVAALRDPGTEVLVSAVSAWEAAVKFRAGRWPEVAMVVTDWDRLMAESRFTPLPITQSHAFAAAALDWPHRDPFDRLLVAQAQVEGLRLVSADRAITGFATDVLLAA